MSSIEWRGVAGVGLTAGVLALGFGLWNGSQAAGVAGVVLIAAMALAADFRGIRSRIPLLNSDSPPVAASALAVLTAAAVLGISSLVVVQAPATTRVYVPNRSGPARPTANSAGYPSPTAASAPTGYEGLLPSPGAPESAGTVASPALGAAESAGTPASPETSAPAASTVPSVSSPRSVSPTPTPVIGAASPAPNSTASGSAPTPSLRPVPPPAATPRTGTPVPTPAPTSPASPPPFPFPLPTLTLP